MSWLDKKLSEFVITTGDSKKYTLFWKNPAYAIEFNIAEFKFPNLKGTRVERGMPMGRKLNLEVYIVGPDHLDQLELFATSANDKRPWRLQHPYYGLLFVQPVSISVSNVDDNVTRLEIPVIETILDDNPKQKVDPVDSIILDKAALDEQGELELTQTIDEADVNTLEVNAKKHFNLSIPVIKVPEEVTKFMNAFNQANSFIANATAAPLAAMRAVTALLSAPAKFKASVKDRVNLLTGTFNNLKANVANLTTVSSKQLHQIQSTAVLSSICLAAATPDVGDYTNKRTVLDIIDTIIDSYNSYKADLDTLQSTNGGNPASYIPGGNAGVGLDAIIFFTLSNLYNIALNSRTERSIITEKDTNLILLTHRLYSLDKDDNNMLELMANNGWGLNHLLIIEKGTKVVYYI